MSAFDVKSKTAFQNQLQYYISPLAMIVRYKNLVVQLSLHDIKSRYSSSFLGAFWTIVLPLSMLAAYAFIYIFVFKVKTESMTSVEYIMFIFAGLVPYLSFADSLAMGASSISSSGSLIKNTLFPIELLSVKGVVVSQVSQSVGLMLIVLMSILKQKISIYFIFLPYVWLMQMFFCIGLVWIISTLNVFIRDIQQAVSLVLMVLLMLSPISYSVDMVPDKLKQLVYLNPLYYIISCYQDLIIFQRLPSIFQITILTVMSLTIFYIGYYLISKLKASFSDYV